MALVASAVAHGREPRRHEAAHAAPAELAPADLAPAEPAPAVDGQLDAEQGAAAAAALQPVLPTPSTLVPRLPKRLRSWVVRRAVVAADLVACTGALLFVQFAVVHRQDRDFAIDGLLVIGLVGWVLVAKVYGFYDQQNLFRLQSSADDVPAIILLTTLATWLGIVALQVTGLSHPRLSIAMTYWLVALVFLTVMRACARTVVRAMGSAREPVLILGSGFVADRIATKLGARRSHGLDVIGYLDDDPHGTNGSQLVHLGPTSRLETVIRAFAIQHVIVAFPRVDVESQVKLIRRCMELGVQLDIVPRMFEVIGSRSRVREVEGMPLVQLTPAKLSFASQTLKRCLDLCVGACVLLLFAPFMAFAALRIKRQSPGPVFFKQERMGAGGRRFEIVKFRTMFVGADQQKSDVAHLNKHSEPGSKMFKIPDDPRVTPFGRLLRRWSLDELPQLFNVLRGEMSLVGPRPLILGEDENIVGQHRHRLDLRPGITGMWQVLGRSDIPFAEMITLDYLYVTNWTLWGDVKLLIRTIPAVLQRRGAY